MAVLIPSLLPPPSPFKIFVLLAGVVGISVARFATAIAIGRGIRYVALGYLAVRYGSRAGAYLPSTGPRRRWSRRRPAGRLRRIYALDQSPEPQNPIRSCR